MHCQGQVMSTEVGARSRHPEAGAGTGAGSVQRRQSPVPFRQRPATAPGNPSEAARLDPLAGVAGAVDADVLLDLRAGSSTESLNLLVVAARSALSGVVGSAVDCAVTLARLHRAPLVAATSADPDKLARLADASDSSPVAQALAGQVAVVANAYSLHPRWPDYWRVLEDGGYRSQLSAPMLLGAERSAALTLLSSRDNVFTPSVIDSVLVFGKRAAASYVIAENLRAAQLAAEQLR